MIGCDTYTNTIDCYQYINDVMMLKISFLFILIILALLTLYFVNSKKYKQLLKKYHTLNIMFIYPKWSSYLFLVTLVFIPYFLSINTSLEIYLDYVLVFIWTNIIWFLLTSFLWCFNWISNKLGFNNIKHLIYSAFKR